MDVVTIWTGPALVGALIALLGAVLWSLARDPVRLWRMDEGGGAPLCNGAQALSTARAVGHVQPDAEPVPRASRVACGGSIDGAPPAPKDLVSGDRYTPAGATAMCDESELMEKDIAREVRRLAALSTPQEEIACRVGIALAEVQLLIAMQAAKMPRPSSR